jgi:hypothetical protein
MKIGIETMKGNKRREEERRAKEIKTTKTWKKEEFYNERRNEWEDDEETQSEETDNPIAGSHKSVTGLFLCSQLCSQMPQSPVIRVPGTCNVFCLQYTERPHVNAPGKPSLGYQLLHTLSTIFALWTCSGVVACFILKSFKWALRAWDGEHVHRFESENISLEN